MTGPRRTSDAGKAKIADALTRGRPASQRSNPAARVGVRALLALQRDVGNDAVRALLAGKLRFPEERARGDMDAALVELRKDEPAVDTVETGLKAAQSVGIPVELEGPKPPPSALSVTKSGFGPGSVPAKKPPPPTKPVPAKNRLGKAAARPPGPRGGGGNRGGAPGMPSFDGAAPTAVTPGPMAADQLMQPPVPPAHTRPEEDPAFTHVTGAVAGFARSKKAHPPAATKATEAQDAALAPSDDLDSQAKTAKADTMDAQPVGTFDKKAFIAAVKDAVEAKSPKTLKEADNYKESGKAAEVRDDVKGMVTSGKQGESRDIETATAAPPDQSKAVPKPVTPLSTEDPGHAVDVPAGGAAPKPAPPDQLNLEAGKHQTDQEMADGGVTEEQLQDSNEPGFQQAVTDKHAAAAHADTAPGEYRQHEQGVLDQSKSAASASTAEAVAGMQGSKAAALAGLVADKGKTKSKDEAKRAEVSTRIQAIFAAAEADVKQILDGIDPKVDKEFTEGEADARAAFENYVAVKMAAYKEDRYSGWLGGLRWAKDKLLGMPDKVNEFFEAGRELYLKKMDGVISRIADIVGNDLNAAKRRIASGKAEIATYVKSLPRDLKKVGAEATQEIGERFQQLEADVEDKQKSVVDTLATKYTEARKGLDDRIEELQAENKGLVDKAISAIKAVVGTIRDLARMLFDVLARVADVVGQIIKHPIRFLENLVAGVKGGIQKFKDTIVEHLRKGLMTWLFGELADSGIEIPEHFDLKSIVKFIASIFGLTWTNIRNRIVRRIGEPAMSAVEKGVEIFQLLASQGVAGLWQMLVDKLGDIKEMILEQVKDFVVTRIISAGISYLISLLNPAAAFIKACKMIYEIVMFFVNNGKRIIDLVNAIIDSVADMVRGNVGAVVDKIDDVLGRMVPIIIGFLASLLNLGGIGEKIREIVNMLRKPVTKAIDFLVDTGLKLAGPIIRGVAGISRKVKAKIAAGKAWVKGKVQGAQQAVRGAMAAILGKVLTPKTVVMRKAAHVVSYEKSGDRYVVMLASDKDRLTTKVHRALQNSAVQQNPELVAHLKTVLETVRIHEERINHYKFEEPNQRETAKAEGELTHYSAMMISQLAAIGKVLDLDVLKGGKYVLDAHVHPDYVGRIRATFYGPSSSYQHHLPAKRQQAINAKLALYPDPNQYPDSFWCPGWKDGGRLPHLAKLSTIQLDHVRGAATHWTEIGHNCTQAERVAYYTSEGSLIALCDKCNGAKQSAGDIYDTAVGPNFSGPGGLR